MKIFFNHIILEFQNEISISEMLEYQQISAEKGVAVAVNNTVAPKTSWDRHILKDNDKVTIIRATRGG